jgi:hypothetical protein
MPYPKTSTGYPIAMREAVERVGGGQEVMTIVCDTEKEARSLRSRYYQYFTALRRDCQNPPTWISKPDVLALTQKSLNCEMHLAGKTFVMRPRDKSPVVDTLAKAQWSSGEPAVMTEKESESLDKLMQKIGGLK